MGTFKYSGGVEVTGFISPTDPLDDYPVIDPLYGIDGFRNVNGLSDLDLIPELRRRAGMVVGVNNGADYYKLNAGPWTFTFTDWSTFNTGGGGGTSGTSGSSGRSGSSGTSGTSGSSGTSGGAGEPGASGTNGTSGSSGSSGISGSSGTSGTNGSSGTSGSSGSSGRNGTNGTNGINGTNGSSGTSGTNGSSGINGTNGTSGSSGSSGRNGTNGTNGSSGTSGTNGTNGTNGSSGTSGTNGTSGSSGTGFTTIASPGNNRVLTSDGTSNAAVAQSKITFDGIRLTVTGDTNIIGSLTVNGNISTTGTTTFGNGTFTKAGSATGDVFLDNGGTDTPGVLFYYDNNSNYGIDSWKGSFDVLSGQLVRITNKLNETGGVVRMALDSAGNVVFPGFIKANAWRAGQVINDIMLSNTEVTISTTTIATSASDTDFLTYSYTPLSSTSYLVIHYHLANFSFEGGTGNDTYISRIKVDGGEITYSRQSTINGNRTGVLFPLTGRYTNSNTTAKSIVVAARRDSADDSITIVNSSSSMWLRITEIAR